MLIFASFDLTETHCENKSDPDEFEHLAFAESAEHSKHSSFALSDWSHVAVAAKVSGSTEKHKKPPQMYIDIVLIVN